MKKLILLLLVLFAAVAVNAQCTTKCINSTATASVGLDPTWTYQWSVTGGLTFTGQGTNQISFASVGSVVGTYTITCLITSPYCDSTITGDLCVIETTPTLTLPLVCQSNGSVAVSGGTPAGGTYYDAAGNVITTLTSALIGQSITYTAASGGCTGSTTAVLGGAPVPNTTITIN